ncbi:MAG: hypothetical protein H3C54_09090 [Taibaiella sp.]|nr:hypothetical protein [Taibaiella sp.]
MKNMLLFLILNIFACARSIAQEKGVAQSIADKERIQAINTLDSLCLKDKYQEIINFCDESKYHLSSVCTYNLIGAYYLLGDSATAWRLLDKEINGITSNSSNSPYALDVLLGEDYSSYKKFLLISSAKNYIINTIDSLYVMEPITEKESGKELMHLLIEDQWIRKMSSLYDHFKPGRKHLLPGKIDSMDAIKAQRDHCTKVFDFYQKQNKLFSKTEVGRIYYRQLFLFFHEWDMTRRDFYHKLLKEGVTSGAFKIEALMNFEMSTQFIEMGALEFSKHRDEIQEEYRKKYSKPGYRYSIY